MRSALRIRVTRTDWFRVLMDLKRAGMSLESIATAVEVSKSAVIGWKNLDAEPKHGDGERLIALWQQATGCARADLPAVPMVGNPTGSRPDTRPA